MKNSVSLLSILLIAFFVSGIVGAQNDVPEYKTRGIVSKIERKILENENGWRLSKKTAGSYFSLNTWTSDKGSINVTIINYMTPQKAMEDFIKGKGTTSKGIPRDLNGFGDAAYENVNGDQPSSIIFVRGTTIVGVEPSLLSKKEQPVLERFARQMLDAIDNK